MRRIFFVTIAVLFAAGFALGIFGFWRGLKESLKQDAPSSVIQEDVAKHIVSKSDLVILSEPKPISAVKSPLVIKGEARGQWFFEATFPVVLTDWDGRIIAEHYAEAVLNPNDPDSTWMTTEFVPFESVIEFKDPSFPGVGADHFSRRGTLILRKSNPSGLPEHDDALEIPINF